MTRLSDNGYPLVLLSHRKQEFIGRTMWGLRELGKGITDVIVVDDSGDTEHHDWLDDHGFQFSIVDPHENKGYLHAMNVVWEAARRLCDEQGTDYAVLWEEDFRLVKPVDFRDLAYVMDEVPWMAQLNLQRQPVYRVERQHGYLESHQRRGYELSDVHNLDGRWYLERKRPFTTNPGMIRREVLDIPWPPREACDMVDGGAEPAMSLVLEGSEPSWGFGWYGEWNTPHTQHVGTDMKSGTGY